MRCLFLLLIPFISCFPKNNQVPESDNNTAGSDGAWISLFNGKDLTGWRANENPESFRVENGLLIANGERSHLFYEGPELGEGFDHFELEVELRTYPKANSGIYVHTQYQDSGWPEKGFEVQVNQSHEGEGGYHEFKKSGSLYGVRNTYYTNVKDGEWYKTRIIVNGDRVQIFVNDVQTVDYYQFYDDENAKKLSKGTFAIQGHDPGSKVEYKSIKVKRLELEPSAIRMRPLGEWHKRMLKIQQSKNFPFLDLNPDIVDDGGIDERIENGFVTGVNVGFIWDETVGEELLLAYLDRSIVVGKQYGTDIEDAKITYTIGSAAIVDLKTVINNKGLNIVTVSTAEDEKILRPLLADLAKNKVAIQIDNILKLPQMAFIKEAAAAGCLFSFRGISLFDMPGNSTYFLDAVEQANIDYKQIYVPQRAM